MNVTTSIQAGLSDLQKDMAIIMNAHATSSEVDGDCEVIIKLSPRATQQYRECTDPETLQIANHALQATSKATSYPALAGISFLAARQLNSGELSLTLSSAAQAEVARRHRWWATRIDMSAKIQISIWAVVADGVPVESMVLPGRVDAIINQLTNDNAGWLGMEFEINHVGWLTKAAAGKKGTSGKKKASIVVEFTTPQAANKAIDLGLIWDATHLRTRIYDESARIKQCYNCQKYSHIGRTCPNQTACAHCAEDHQTRDCPRKQAADTNRRCANCGDAHAAWSKACVHYQNEAARAQAAEASRERYHRVPAYLASEPAGEQTA